MDADFKPHMFTYRYKGDEWVVEILAEDADDAAARLKALAYARYDGPVIASIPAFPGAGTVVNAACATHNALRKLLAR